MKSHWLTGAEQFVAIAQLTTARSQRRASVPSETGVAVRLPSRADAGAGAGAGAGTGAGTGAGAGAGWGCW